MVSDRDQRGSRKLWVFLVTGTAVYVLLAGWLTFAGVRHRGANMQSAFVYASLVAAWPVCWAAALWPAVVNAGFGWRATALIAWTVLQVVIAAALAYLQAATVTSYFDALPLLLLAFFDVALWCGLVGIARAERAVRRTE